MAVPFVTQKLEVPLSLIPNMRDFLSSLLEPAKLTEPKLMQGLRQLAPLIKGG
jgi:hypothetical protein